MRNTLQVSVYVQENGKITQFQCKNKKNMTFYIKYKGIWDDVSD